MRRATFAFAVTALFVLGACDGSIMGPDASLTPDGPAWSSQSEVSYLVDTGTPTGNTIDLAGELAAAQNGSWFRFLGGQFTLDADGTAGSVEAFLWVLERGSVEVVIRSDEDGLPGTVVAAETYEVSTTNDPEWVSFPDFSATLPAGTYWLALEPVAESGFYAFMRLAAPEPLPAYRSMDDNSNGWSLMNSNPGFGLRIAGAGPVEQESSSLLEQLESLADQVAALDVNRGTRNSLEALLRNAVRQLNAGETDSACGMLQAFTHQINAQSGRQIPTEVADDLTGQVEEIRGELEC